MTTSWWMTAVLWLGLGVSVYSAGSWWLTERESRRLLGVAKQRLAMADRLTVLAWHGLTPEDRAWYWEYDRATAALITQLATDDACATQGGQQ